MRFSLVISLISSNFAGEIDATMINRDIIRTKVLQTLYAAHLNGDKSIDALEKELFFSFSKAYELYMNLLWLMVAITREATKLHTALSKRAEEEGEEPPSSKFVKNRFAMQLEANEALQEFVSKQGTMVASAHPELVTRLYILCTRSAYYKQYMKSKEDSYEEDRELWRKLYRVVIQQDEDIDNTLEDDNIFWNDDKEIVDTFVLKTIKRFDEANGSKQELLSQFDSDEEPDFAKKLLRAAVENEAEYRQMMDEVLRNWNINRLALMDTIVMQTAIAEILSFPSIPLSVTLNEYIDLAKLYSTPKSGGYVNGTLEAIADNLYKRGATLKKVDRKAEAKGTDKQQTTEQQQ